MFISLQRTPCDCPYAKHTNAVNGQEEATSLEKITKGTNNAENEKKTAFPHFDTFSHEEKVESIGIYKVQQGADGKEIVFSTPKTENISCPSGICTRT